VHTQCNSIALDDGRRTKTCSGSDGIIGNLINHTRKGLWTPKGQLWRYIAFSLLRVSTDFYSFHSGVLHLVTTQRAKQRVYERLSLDGGQLYGCSSGYNTVTISGMNTAYF
jgi:hypothetical protein